AQFTLADYYVETRQYARARDVLNPLVSNPKVSADADTKLAEIDYAESRTAEASQRIDNVLKRAPKFAPARVLKASWHPVGGKLDEALRYATAATEAAPESAVARYLLGVIQEQRGDAAAAIASYHETLRLNPRAVAAQVQLSRLSLASGDPDAAVQYG